MIEKLDIKNGGVEDLLNCINKINEIIDWINDVSALCVTDKQVTANLPNIDSGELAFLSKENSNLKDELERTRKALDAAVDALKEISLRYSDEINAPERVWSITAIDMAEYADTALDQITALEQKD